MLLVIREVVSQGELEHTMPSAKDRLYVVCSIFQVKFVLKMVVIVCSTLVIVCSTGRLNFVLQKMYRFSLFYKKWQV